LGYLYARIASTFAQNSSSSYFFFRDILTVVLGWFIRLLCAFHFLFYRFVRLSVEYFTFLLVLAISAILSRFNKDISEYSFFYFWRFIYYQKMLPQNLPFGTTTRIHSSHSITKFAIPGRIPAIYHNEFRLTVFPWCTFAAF